ncbi:MAG: mechanosensitive ion channel family protein [Anaerolineae bacterium]|nr:mechanosensitive ion channel family protein [Anaerolineae bacterium]
MLHEFLEDQLGQDAANIIAKLLIVVVILLLTWIARGLITLLVSRVVPHITKRTHLKWDDEIVKALQPPVRFLVGVAGLWLAMLALDLPGRIENAFGQVGNALFAFGIFWGIYRLVEPLVEMVWTLSKRAMAGTPVPTVLDEQLSAAATQIGRAVIIILGFAAILEAWGYDVAGVVAGLGIGGLAVALAAQNTLENVLGYFVILADEPFIIGEYIIMGDVSGVVEAVGFRSTRVRALDQSLITVPNKTIANANIVNWSRLAKRRLNMTVGITYDSSPDQILGVVQTLREMLQNHEQVQDDSVVVQFVNFNDSSLDLMIICFANIVDWGDFQAFKQDVNLRIMNILGDYRAEIAFPSRTIYHYMMGEYPSTPESVPLPEPEPIHSTASDQPAGGDSQRAD